MNALAAARPRRFGPVFQAWRLCGQRAYALGLYDSLDEAVSLAAPSCQHKDQLAVLETGRDPKILHVYQIRQGARTYRHDPVTKTAVAFHPLKASQLFSQAVKAFEPQLAWTCEPGADVVGIDRNVVELRS